MTPSLSLKLMPTMLILLSTISACGGGGTTAATYAVGGTVAGLSGTNLVLELNGTEKLPVSKNGSFSFTTRLQAGAAFQATVLAQPDSSAALR